LFGEGGDDVTDEDSLLAKGIIDSTGVLELVSFLTETYGIQIEDDELIPDNFDSIKKLAAFVARKQAANESTATPGE
jgi:acyl carrier protein